MNRRDFLGASAAAMSVLAAPAWGQPRLRAARPKLTFYGSTQQVSGSCHLLETSLGLFVVDCGLFYADLPEHEKENREFPFDPKEVKALFLTHAHVDHNGRLPLLYAKGFRGPVYCTDATRDLSQVMLDMSAGVPRDNDEEKPLYEVKDLDGILGQFQAVPYNTKIEKQGLKFRYTDAGHILGSAMVEVWVDGVKILFSGDMGPDWTPILCKPTQHFGADAVLIESTYGPVPRDEISYEEFGKRIMKVIKGGGSVLLPAFALHKTQCLIYVLHKLAKQGILDPQVPIVSDSSTAAKVTEFYEKYKEYYDPEAKDLTKKVPKLFYRNRYRELSQRDSLTTHGKEPMIYISTSGMLDHAAAPKHLYKMAEDEKNAVFIVGYQSPTSIGRKLQSGVKKLSLPWEEFTDSGVKREMKEVEVKLQVEKASGFSSHARGGQILEWLHEFRRVGQVFVVHGDQERATGLADAVKKMGLPGTAPKRGETFTISGERIKPGPVPPLKAVESKEPAPVDK